jgi:16S rRNA (adenine1518-N6/adenine1519-N6)-dimethyltransferase
MTKQSMQDLLETYGGRPLQSLSQNFLIDENLARKIASGANIETSHVVEIGPGLGALTEHLIKTYESVTVFELDATYARILADQFPGVSVNHVDFLDSAGILQTIEQPYVVIANIPYHITAQLIRFCLTTPNPPQEFVFLMQKEVAERIVDENTPSILQLSIEMYAESRYLFTVPKSCFYPQPRVDSAVVRFSRRTKPLCEYPEEVIGFLKEPFGKRRKILLSTLRKLYSSVDWDEIFSTLSIPQKVRPEDLTLESWILLYNEYKKISTH